MKLDISTFSVKVEETVIVSAPPSFLDVLINNLLKNANSYAQGDILVYLDSKQLIIRNQFNQDDSDNGFGYGLVIIERICNRLNWRLNVEKHNGDFCVTVFIGS
jgi:hypothetical protein